MWCVPERDVSKLSHKTLASLRAKISEIIADMEREVISSACQKFPSRSEAVVEAKKDFIE